MKFKQYLIIYLFIAVCGSLSFISFQGHFNEFGSEHAPNPNAAKGEQLDESFFKNVNYFSLVNNRPFLELHSSELSLSDNNQEVIGFDPKGVLYRFDKQNKAQEPITFEAKNSRAFLPKKELHLNRNVVVKVAKTEFTSQKLSVINDGEELRADGDVNTSTTIEKTDDQIIVTSSKVTYRPKELWFEFKNSVHGQIKRRRVFEQSLEFDADLLSLNGRENLASMTGNVSFKKDNLEVLARRGEVFLENYNKRLKYYALYDDVRLQESLVSNDKPIKRKAVAEKLEGLISEKKIILTGLPKVFQDRDVIKGNRIIIRENIETVEVDDANSSITLDPDKY